MPLPFSREQFFDLFVAYNEALWPVVVALWLASAATAVLWLSARRPHDRWVSALLAVHWAWSAVAYHVAFFTRINPAAWLFAALFLAQAVLFTDSPVLADAVVAAVERQLETLPRRAIAAASWRDLGAVVLLEDLADAPALVDRLAPEHLELLVAEPEAMAARIENAGAIFLGAHTPEVIGDYVGGPNHVLPTGGTARFASPLGVYDFVKRTSVMRATPRALAQLAPTVHRLAAMEGLEAHAAAVERRVTRRAARPVKIAGAT